MANEKLLTVREVSMLIGISEKEVLDLAETGLLPAYKVGGVYIRFKQNQVESYRLKNKSQEQMLKEYSFWDRICDFFYYNDFYILSFGLIIGMLLIIFKQ